MSTEHFPTTYSVGDSVEVVSSFTAGAIHAGIVAKINKASVEVAYSDPHAGTEGRTFNVRFFGDLRHGVFVEAAGVTLSHIDHAERRAEVERATEERREREARELREYHERTRPTVADILRYDY